MKGYLLDTNIALLAVDTPERLSKAAHRAIAEGPCFLSVISYWEVMVKAMKGTLNVGDPRSWWTETLNAVMLTPLAFTDRHVSALYSLPPLHQDPFDRALIAQAIVEELTLVTMDRTIPEYASENLSVIR